MTDKAFDMSNFSGSDFDVFDLLHWMFAKQQTDGVRDFLVNKLYEVPNRDVDFILPQLCHLYTQWSDEHGESLGQYLMCKSSVCITLALKIIFNLHANSAYGTPEQTARCESLLQQCEMSLVNAKVSLGSGDPERAVWNQRKQSQAERRGKWLNALLDDDKKVGEATPSEAEDMTRPPTPQPESSPEPSTTEPSADADQGEDTQKEEEGQEAPAEDSAGSEGEGSSGDAPAVVIDPALASAEGGERRGRSMTARAKRDEEAEAQLMQMELDEQELALIKTKHLRSEYFNQELKLISDLDELSEALVKVPRKNDRRVKRLQQAMRALNKSIHGLYFPSNEGGEDHYKVLQIPSEACFSLNSRDKAPFLMHLEVADTGKSVYDEDIYTTYQGVHDEKYFHKSDNKEEGAAGEGGEAVDGHSRNGSISLGKHRGSVKKEKADQEQAPPEGKGSPNAVPARPSTPAEEMDELKKSIQVVDLNNKSTREAFGELWDVRKRRLRAKSRYGQVANWNLKSVIFKGGDDCRQEVLAMQLIRLFDEQFKEAKLPLRLCTYSVMVTSAKSGLIETIPNSKSIDSIKKDVVGFTSLAKFFEDYFGPKGSPEHDLAQRNFVESMAAYSVVCYFLQIKDRHNGNIMMDSEGHIIHIDFGFMLSNSPGGNINFESCPFKLTQEFVEVMEGEGSDSFNYFKVLLIRGYLEARKCAQKVLMLVEVMMQGSNMACFLGGPATLQALKDRFMLEAPEQECVEHAYGLVEESINNWRTVQYDKYQTIVNDIL